MANSNEKIKKILFPILLITLIPLPRINEKIFFLVATIFHILLCKKIASLIPEAYKVTKLLCFLFLLGLVTFSISGLSGLSNGIIGTIENFQLLPLVYQKIWEDIGRIPPMIINKDLHLLTSHIFLLGITGIFALGKHLYLSRERL